MSESRLFSLNTDIYKLYYLADFENVKEALKRKAKVFLVIHLKS